MDEKNTVPRLLAVSPLKLVAAAALSMALSSQAIAQTSPPLPPPAAATGPESALLARHTALAAQLANNAFRRPLVLESSDANGGVSGNAYAVLDAPFATVSNTFRSPNRWCDVLILHLNTKQCKANAEASTGKIAVHVGRKKPQALSDASLLEFDYRVVSSSPRYMASQLNAEKGPMGTSAYKIEIQAAPLSDGKTFMHLRYSYGYNTASRLAMQAYLGTLGSGKIGFTQATGAGGDATSGYVTGLRGAIERNTMRYYLAIDTYLASLKLPPSQQVDARLESWFDATEQYASQLHEVDRAEYIAMKKAELLRQQSASGGG